MLLPCDDLYDFLTSERGFTEEQARTRIAELHPQVVEGYGLCVSLQYEEQLTL
jgi:hypothetical protein